MKFEHANMKNLTRLWHAYGGVSSINASEFTVKFNSQWPFRCWLSNQGTSLFTENTILDAGDDWLEKLPPGTVIPVWAQSPNETSSANDNATKVQQQLEKRQWHHVLEQTAMYRRIESDDCLPVLAPNYSVELVQSDSDIEAWCDVVSHAFNYTISREIIERLTGLKHVLVVLFKYHDVPVATGLLFKTNEVIGIHQVGVLPKYRGRGIARELMHQLISLSVTALNGCHLVLQASKAGEPLYKSLGFKRQFTISSYQKMIET